MKPKNLYELFFVEANNLLAVVGGFVVAKAASAYFVSRPSLSVPDVIAGILLAILLTLLIALSLLEFLYHIFYYNEDSDE